MLPYFLETNVFLRQYINDNPTQHQNCNLLFTQIYNGKLDCTTSTPVMTEIVWTLTTFYKKSRTDIADFLYSIFDLKTLKIVDDCNHRTALDFYETYQIKYIDCLIASSQGLIAGKWQLVSYDRDFDKIKGLKRLEPQDLKY